MSHAFPSAHVPIEIHSDRLVHAEPEPEPEPEPKTDEQISAEMFTALDDGDRELSAEELKR